MPIPDNSQTADTKTLEALYNLNKHARKYADLADKNYRQNKGATARANSCKKKALYTVKEKILRQIVDQAETVERHTINGDQFYCLYFPGDGTDWSFHTPVQALEISEDRVTGEENLDEFEKDAEKEHSNMSLKDALLHVEATFDLNANEHLPQKKVGYGSKRYFIGWKYLGDSSGDTS
jgi:hypothetical protein